MFSHSLIRFLTLCLGLKYSFLACPEAPADRKVWHLPRTPQEEVRAVLPVTNDRASQGLRQGQDLWCPLCSGVENTLSFIQDCQLNSFRTLSPSLHHHPYEVLTSLIPFLQRHQSDSVDVRAGEWRGAGGSLRDYLRD